MRRTLASIAIPCAALFTTVGCASIYHLDEYSLGDDGPGGAAATAGDGAMRTLRPAVATDVRPSCRANADCAVDSGAPSICVKATGTCAPLVTNECPRVYGDWSSDDAMFVGALLDSDLDRSVAQAVSEIGAIPSRAAAGAFRPVAVVSCDARPDALAAARHLVDDLRVAAVVGPEEAEDVVDVTQQVTVARGALLVTPTSTASSISSLVDDGLTWRVVPSDDQRATLVIDQMSALEQVLRSTRSLTSVKLAIVHATDARGQSARDSISGKLILNGRFINDAANAANVSIDAYAPADATALAAIVRRYAGTFRPDVVYVTAPEQVSDVIVPLEQALTAARVVNRPYYVCTDAAKTQALLDAVSSTTLPADIRRRIRGIGATTDTQSADVYAGFVSRFVQKFGASPRGFAAAGAYDATYAIAYALAASTEDPPTGASVARGLGALGVGAASTVGPDDAAHVMQSLSSGKSVSLRGANTLLHWNDAGDIAGGTVEVWCIGTADGAPAFGSSGLKMDVETQVVGGAFVQCQ